MFLSLALAGGEWSVSRPGRFTRGERAHGTHWIGGWMGPRTGLDNVESRNSHPQRDSNPDPSTLQSVASRYTDCAIPTPLFWNSYFRRTIYFHALSNYPIIQHCITSAVEIVLLNGGRINQNMKNPNQYNLAEIYTMYQPNMKQKTLTTSMFSISLL
jgi:hypothetical protein